MSHDLICTWLGLPTKDWPPDHYTLLGLEPGETDPVRIEHHVHERMQRVRCYQLTHPEQATEAMNRLAQALVSLTAPAVQTVSPTTSTPTDSQQPHSAAGPPAGPASDPLTWIFGPGSAAPPSAVVPVPEAQNQLNWQTSPPPPRGRMDTDTVATSANVDDTTTNAPAPVPAEWDEPARSNIATWPATTGPVAVEAPSFTGRARRGLSTKRGLYFRVARTRQLLWAWEQVGRYLKQPTRELTRPAEATELTTLLARIREVLRNFPPIVGAAGQPGYLVVALARQQMIVQTFQTLVLSQREKLASDWQSGYELLVAHQVFLRDELRAMRHRSVVGHALRALRGALAENPGTILLVLAVVALNLAYPPLHYPRGWLFEQLVVILALVTLKVFLWWDAVEQARPPKPLPSRPPARMARRRPRPQGQTN